MDVDVMWVMLVLSGLGGECVCGLMVCWGYCLSVWLIECVREACDVDVVVDVYVCVERVIDLVGYCVLGMLRNF